MSLPSTFRDNRPVAQKTWDGRSADVHVRTARLPLTAFVQAIHPTFLIETDFIGGQKRPLRRLQR